MKKKQSSEKKLTLKPSTIYHLNSSTLNTIKGGDQPLSLQGITCGQICDPTWDECNTTP